MDPLIMHRIQFGFTITFHYLFPQLTMGLALLIVVLKTVALRTRNPLYNDAARFWAQIFGINFAHGRRHRHPDGVPVRHQLVALLARHRRRHRPDARHGRRVRVLPRVGVPRPVPLRREAARPRWAHWWSAFMVFARLLALRLLHHRHQRLDAASRRLPHAARTASFELTSFWRPAASTPGRSGSTRTT